MATSWNKKERENKKREQRKKKEEKMQMRKEHSADNKKSLDDMMAYLDENGNLTSKPPDPGKRKEFNVEDIEIGVPKHNHASDESTGKNGIVVHFDGKKGFGFIEDSQTHENF